MLLFSFYPGKGHHQWLPHHSICGPPLTKGHHSWLPPHSICEPIDRRVPKISAATVLRAPIDQETMTITTTASDTIKRVSTASPVVLPSGGANTGRNGGNRKVSFNITRCLGQTETENESMSFYIYVSPRRVGRHIVFALVVCPSVCLSQNRVRSVT